MAALNPAVPGSGAGHWHGVPATATATVVPGTVLMQGLPPLHIGDPWFVHYVPEWESAHPTFVTTGAANVLCDGRPVAVSCFSNVTCGMIVKSPVQTVVIKP